MSVDKHLDCELMTTVSTRMQGTCRLPHTQQTKPMHVTVESLLSCTRL